MKKPSKKIATKRIHKQERGILGITQSGSGINREYRRITRNIGEDKICTILKIEGLYHSVKRIFDKYVGETSGEGKIKKI